MLCLACTLPYTYMYNLVHVVFGTAIHPCTLKNLIMCSRSASCEGLDHETDQASKHTLMTYDFWVLFIGVGRGAGGLEPPYIFLEGQSPPNILGLIHVDI